METRTVEDGFSISINEDHSKAPHPGRIINVTSSHFISAIRRDI